MIHVLLSKACIVLVLSLMVVGSGGVGAAPLISHVQTGGSTGATREFIAVYNNSDEPIDVTDWCLIYSSASDVTKTQLVCLVTDHDLVRIYLEPYGYIRFASNEFVGEVVDFMPDKTFTAGMAAAGGHLRLMDALNQESDRVGWGTAVTPEHTVVPAHALGKLLQRKLAPDQLLLLQDTNNNLADFSEVTLQTIPTSGLYEVELVDVCPNIPGAQSSLPDGYDFDENAHCVIDLCVNIDGVQAVVPEGFGVGDDGICSEVVAIVYPKIIITELLPNVAGTDTGKEYVELYNPGNEAASLAGYRLELGPAFTKSFVLPDILLQPLSFVTFSDIVSGITLPNSSGSVRLLTPDAQVMSETDAYENPKDDQAWALINDIWQYTTVPTPGAVNQLPLVTGGIGGDDELADCGPGKFRNTETNRCKAISADDQELTPCAAGQERNPATNRCRAVTTAAGLVPCREGQERNPETNRCRNIASTASTLVPCAPGQERNPATNRCRSVQTLGASTLNDVNDIPAATSSSSGFNWLIVAGLATAIFGYAAYEWRTELTRFGRRAIGRSAR